MDRAIKRAWTRRSGASETRRGLEERFGQRWWLGVMVGATAGVGDGVQIDECALCALVWFMSLIGTVSFSHTRRNGAAPCRRCIWAASFPSATPAALPS